MLCVAGAQEDDGCGCCLTAGLALPPAGTQRRRHRCVNADRAGEQRCQEAGGRASAHCAAPEAARAVLLVISCSLLGAATLALRSAVPAAARGSGGFVFLICLLPHASVWSFPASASLARVHRLVRTHDVAPGIFIHSCYRRSLCSRHPDFACTVSLPSQLKQRGKELGLPKDSSRVWSPP